VSDLPDDGRLQDYLDGRLSPDERTAFEERLRDDPELTRAVHAARRVGEALREEDAALSPGFYARARRRFEEETAPSPGPLRFLSWESAGLAAAAVLASVLFAPYFLRDGAPEPGLPRSSVTTPLDDTAARAEKKKSAVAPSAPIAELEEIVAAPEPVRNRENAPEKDDRLPADRAFASSPQSAAAARGKLMQQSVAGSASPAVTAVALPVGAVEPGSFRTVARLNEWANLLVKHREALDPLGAVDRRRRLVLVGARDDLDDCAALVLISVSDGWEVRYHPVDRDPRTAGARGGCALTVPQDGKPVRLATAP